jgi:hypothetical protein
MGIEEISEAQNAEMLDVNAVACVLRRPSAAHYLTVELAALKEMTRELASLFGLTLPVSYKK